MLATIPQLSNFNLSILIESQIRLKAGRAKSLSAEEFLKTFMNCKIPVDWEGRIHSEQSRHQASGVVSATPPRQDDVRTGKSVQSAAPSANSQ